MVSPPRETTDLTRMSLLSLKKMTRGVIEDLLLVIDVGLRTEDQDPVEEERDQGQGTIAEQEAEAVTEEAGAETEEAGAEIEEEIEAGKEWRGKENVREETENGDVEKKETERKGEEESEKENVRERRKWPGN